MNRTKFIVAGNLIDGDGVDGRKDVLLTVRDGIITAIGAAADLCRHDGATIIDFSHCTIVPALFDCSVSLSRSPALAGITRPGLDNPDLAKKTAVLERHIRDCHAHGVLGAADNDDVSRLFKPCPGEMNWGRLIDIKRSNRSFQSRQDCAAEDHDPGDFIRITCSSDIDNFAPLFPRPDRKDMARILRHRGKKKAVAVANGRQQVEEALAAGCDAIEQGYAMGEDNLQKMAEMDVLWIPSVLRAKNALDSTGGGGNVCCRFSRHYIAPGKPDPDARAFWEKTLAGQIKQLRLAKKLGLTTATGTGAGSAGILHGESMVEEMKLFIKAGYSLVETIRCASTNGTEFFGMKNSGPLTAGRKATFLVTRGTPQQLPRKLAWLEDIYIDGVSSATYRENPAT